jgi:hypothetical protein
MAYSGLPGQNSERPRRDTSAPPAAVGADKEAAGAAARAYLERTFSMYRAWRMQESAMVELELSHDAPLDDWTINGSPDDLCRGHRPRQRDGARAHRLQHLQPAARGRRADRVHADDRRANPEAGGRACGDLRSRLMLRPFETQTSKIFFSVLCRQSLTPAVSTK